MLFSLIIPTYNRAHLITKTLDAVLAQTLMDFECIVVDDGSTDATEQVLRTFSDPRVQYYKKENGERGAARNFGARKAMGKYLTFLDSDDILYPEHLQEAVRFIAEKKDPKIFFHRYEYLLDSGEKYPAKITLGSDPLKSLAWMNVMIPSATFVQREVFLKYPFDEDRRFNLAEDLYVWMRIGCRFPILYNPKTTIGLYQHEGRSMAHPKPEVITYCLKKLQELLTQDECFKKDKLGLIPQIKATHLSLMALSFALYHHPNPSIRHLIQAIRLSPKEMFRRRSLAILKHIFLGLFP